MTKLENENLKRAKLSVPTRWKSFYDMVERLLELKDFCMENISNDENLNVNDELWTFMLNLKHLMLKLKHLNR